MIPVPVPPTPLVITDPLNAEAELLLAAIAQVMGYGTSGAAVTTPPTLTPVPGSNPPTVAPLKLLTPNQQLFYRQLAIAIVSSGIAGPPGPPGPPGPGDFIGTLYFTYQTSSPSLLQAVSAGQILNRAVVVMTTPFDDPSSSVLLGTTTIPNSVLDAGDVTTGIVDQYESESLVVFGISDFLQFTINPASSTQGAGLLFYRIKE